MKERVSLASKRASEWRIHGCCLQWTLAGLDCCWTSSAMGLSQTEKGSCHCLAQVRAASAAVLSAKLRSERAERLPTGPPPILFASVREGVFLSLNGMCFALLAMPLKADIEASGLVPNVVLPGLACVRRGGKEGENGMRSEASLSFKESGTYHSLQVPLQEAVCRSNMHQRRFIAKLHDAVACSRAVSSVDCNLLSMLDVVWEVALQVTNSSGPMYSASLPGRVSSLCDTFAGCEAG